MSVNEIVQEMISPIRPHRPSLITLTTDFGTSDTFVGVMKGVILNIAPEARIVDLTHAVSPQNILEASVRLEGAIDYFPSGTIHLVVVDPGVGSIRHALVVETEQALFVAPDNGVLTLPLLRHSPLSAVRITEKAAPYLLPNRSSTFHGRDVFAPLTAELARHHRPLETYGERILIENLVRLPLKTPTSQKDAAGNPLLQVPILYSDRFGNLITSLKQEDLERWLQENGAGLESASSLRIQAGSREWTGIARTFTDVALGDPLAYRGSEGRLEIAIRNGNAATELGLTGEDTIALILPSNIAF